MPSNRGFLNEEIIAKAIDGKRFIDINHNLQYTLRAIFPEISNDDIVEAKQLNDIYKPDISVTYKGITKYISIKSGHAVEVHSEKARCFADFLRKHGVSERTIETFLLFHYGDGTTDGTGTNKLNNYDLMVKYRDRIAEANEELNKSTKLMVHVIHHTMFQGIDPKAKVVDYMYFGNAEYGNIISKHQIRMFLEKKCWKYFNMLHCGPIFFKPRARYINGPVKSEYRRHMVMCYWPNIAEDFCFIGNRYTFRSN